MGNKNALVVTEEDGCHTGRGQRFPSDGHSRSTGDRTVQWVHRYHADCRDDCSWMQRRWMQWIRYHVDCSDACSWMQRRWMQWIRYHVDCLRACSCMRCR